MNAATALPVDRCVVMGILNVTPDSFSDGGRFEAVDSAIGRGMALAALGADIVDVGGESTRPGADRVPEPTELARVVPVVEALASGGVRVSVDTTRASVARRCVEAGAWMVNDVSGTRADPQMAATLAELDVPCVLMHWRGHSAGMTRLAVYADVVGEVVAELRDARDSAVAAGVRPERIVLDPGLGFAKDAVHNWAILRRLDALHALGHPVLVGASRKRFLGELLAAPSGVMRPPDGRDAATAAVTALVAASGAWGVRVHDVGASVDAALVAARLMEHERAVSA